MVERSTSLLQSDADVGVVVPALRIRAADGSTLREIHAEPDLATVIATPLATPPVMAFRRAVWQALGGLREEAGDFAWCDWWLRLFASGTRIGSVREPLASLPVTERDWWPPLTPGPVDLVAYRRLLETHRDLLDREMADLVVRQEIAFGRLLAQHRSELQHRDRRLAELERIRAEAAHHRAFLEHHGRTVVDWGDLRRTDPISRDWGYDRGVPIDRRYIEDFLAAHSSDISGLVLEVQEDDFTRRFGGARVTGADVIDLDESNDRATIVTDLRAATGVQDAQFDCIILTQTLHVIDDVSAVIRECHRMLRPGGVLLATLPSASRVCLEYGEEGDLWRMTPAGGGRLFESAFGPGNVEVRAYGNVLTNVAFLHGFACDELTDGEFETTDSYHPVLVGVRARKPLLKGRRADANRGVVLLYHRIDEQPDVHELGVPAAQFEEHLAWLSRECHVIPLDQLLAAASVELPDRAVAITFDDGYRDILEVAAPLLQRWQLPATVFATCRWLEEYGEYWWDTLEGALLQTGTPAELTLDVNGSVQRFSASTPPDRRAAHDALHMRLVHAALEEREAIVSQIARWAGRVPDARRRPLVADELRQLACLPGLAIGAHGVNHLAVPDQSPEVQRVEVLDSARHLQHVLGKPVTTVAFPYGSVDRTSADLARTNFLWSFACGDYAVRSSFDAARVPRFEVRRSAARALSQHLERLFAPSSG